MPVPCTVLSVRCHASHVCHLRCQVSGYWLLLKKDLGRAGHCLCLEWKCSPVHAGSQVKGCGIPYCTSSLQKWSHLVTIRWTSQNTRLGKLPAVLKLGCLPLQRTLDTLFILGPGENPHWRKVTGRGHGMLGFCTLCPSNLELIGRMYPWVLTLQSSPSVYTNTILVLIKEEGEDEDDTLLKCSMATDNKSTS